MGGSTTASDYGSLVIGQYNSSGSSVTNSATAFSTANTAFVIGNGANAGSLSDAFKVMFNGDTYVSNSLYLGGTKITSTATELNLLNGATSLGTGILSPVTENSNTGVRLSTAVAANHGDIGSNAVDLSYDRDILQAQREVQQEMLLQQWENPQQQVEILLQQWDFKQQQVEIILQQWEEAQKQVEMLLQQWDKAQKQVDIILQQWDITQKQVEISTAMGASTTASGNSSTAMGVNTTASGDASTAMGGNTEASGENSTAMGDETTASDYGSLVIGQYNSSGSSVTRVQLHFLQQTLLL